ncbi:hypothetical protein Bca101_062695 [Brassica carinata]
MGESQILRFSWSLKTFFTLWIVFFNLLHSFSLQAQAAPSSSLIKHISTVLKWTTGSPSSKTSSQSDTTNVVQFENGYLVETVVEGNEIGFLPCKIRVSDDGELYAVDEVNSNIVKITPPLSHYSRGRLVAGSFQGKTGHADGKPSEARFNHPRGVTMDDKGNLYVADTLNLAIRKISDSGVTTIAGGKSNVAGYRDGPSEDAKFSNDFDQLSSETISEEEHPGKEKLKEEPGWPSFTQLLIDLCKLALEFFTSHIVPSRFRTSSNLRPLDRLKMPEDEQEPPLVQRHTAPAPVSESRHAYVPKPSDGYPEHKTAKLRSSSSAVKDPSSKHHRSSSKRQEYAQFYASGEIVQPKVHKERSRSRRRHRDKTAETEPKTTAAETVKPVEYSNSSKFDHFNMRSNKYGPETPFRF